MFGLGIIFLAFVGVNRVSGPSQALSGDFCL